MPKPHTATRAIVANRSGLLNPADAVEPRTRLPKALAAKPAITRTTTATTRFGIHSRNCCSTCETAGRPSASKATTSTIRRTNHLTISASSPEASLRTPIFRTNPLKPELWARSLKRMARNKAATAEASNPAMNQPMIRITRKPTMRGIAAKNKLRAVVSDVIRAALHSLIFILSLPFNLAF